MKYTDYKWWFVRRDDDGIITEVAVRFYEGDYQTVKDENDKDIIIYVREKKLIATDLTHLDKGKNSTDSINQYVRIYLPKDFGEIKTDDELRAFCNSQLAKDIGHNKILEQGVA